MWIEHEYLAHASSSLSHWFRSPNCNIVEGTSQFKKNLKILPQPLKFESIDEDIFTS